MIGRCNCDHWRISSYQFTQSFLDVIPNVSDTNNKYIPVINSYQWLIPNIKNHNISQLSIVPVIMGPDTQLHFSTTIPPLDSRRRGRFHWISERLAILTAEGLRWRQSGRDWSPIFTVIFHRYIEICIQYRHVQTVRCIIYYFVFNMYYNIYIYIHYVYTCCIHVRIWEHTL